MTVLIEQYSELNMTNEAKYEKNPTLYFNWENMDESAFHY